MLRRRCRPVVLLLAMVAGAPTATAATPDADALAKRFQSQQRAATQYQLRILDAAEANDPAQLDDAQAVQLLGAITDQRGLLDEPQYHAGDLQTLMTVCGTAQQSLEQLLLFGIPQTRSIRQLQSAQLEQVKRNAERFQAQQALLLPFGMRCMAHTHPLLEQTLASQPADSLPIQAREGLATMRAGVQRLFAGALTTIEPHDGVPAANPALRQALVQAIADTAPAYARALPLPQRAKIAAQLSMALGRASTEEKALLQPALAAFGSAECVALCQR